MSIHRLIVAASLAISCVSASAQVRAPVSGLAAVKQTISETQTRQLSQTLAQRPAAATRNVDPSKVAAAAGPQPPPVKFSGSKVIPTGPAVTSAPTPAAQSAQVQLVKTTPAEEKLLTGIIVKNDQVRSALSSPVSTFSTLPGIVRMSSEATPALQLKSYAVANHDFARDASGMFRGEILIGITDLAGTASAKLPTPLLFQVIGAAKAEPELVRVDETSPPFSKVEVWLKTVQGAFANLKLYSVIDHAVAPVSVPVASELDVDTANGNIAGFGIESTKVMVTLTNLADAPGRVVTLHVQPSGYLSNSRLVLDAKGTAETELRSGSIGPAQIRATSPGIATVTATVDYAFPFLIIAAALLGGLLGGGARLLRADENKGAPRQLAFGVLYGVLVFAAYAIGINLLAFTPAVTVGALSVFAISALAAFFGPK